MIAVALAQLTNDRVRAASSTRFAAERAEQVAPDVSAAAARLSSTAPAPDSRPDRWIDRLELVAPRAFRLRDPDGVRYLTKRQADALRFPSGFLGVDVRRRTVHTAGTAASFANRPGLWAVLAALLIEPGRVVLPDELAQRAWGAPYHVIRQRSRLVVSINRLRAALRSDVIVTVGGGYCLSSQMWAVLEPNPGSSQPSTWTTASATCE